MKALKLAMTAILAVSTAGCATRASSVAPVSISANEYSTLNCADSRAEANAARERAFALSRRQNNAATADAAAVFLFLLPLGSVFGADVSGELAQAKGEVLALDRRVRMACDAQVSGAPVQEAAAMPGPTGVPATQGLVKPAKACGMVKQANGGSRLVPC
ncbi:MAG: hypothetical protein Q8Q88_12135 [Phenylobacterium sp.]|uniref:hypothetical protein n=1 Tax=Phenylobacterium sp. TaxID=1871053 RepID=UPI002734351F|nr:hypothetical protein [Phenylobacterium sp.]MDP3747784.1 hypothetical protein [Phenylobacterium sp.]